MRILLVLLLAACGFACEKEVREARHATPEADYSPAITPAVPPAESPRASA